MTRMVQVESFGTIKGCKCAEGKVIVECVMKMSEAAAMGRDFELPPKRLMLLIVQFLMFLVIHQKCMLCGDPIEVHSAYSTVTRVEEAPDVKKQN